jgi:hypothetical protein
LIKSLERSANHESPHLVTFSIPFLVHIPWVKNSLCDFVFGYLELLPFSQRKKKVGDTYIKTGCKDMGCTVVDWLHLAQVLVNMVRNLQVL